MKKIALLILFVAYTCALPSSRIAEKCKATKCKLEDECVCSSKKSPLSVEDTPQFVLLTFEDALQTNLFNDFYLPLLFERRNPDGSPISATFFVPHEYTDYTKVNDLYNRGFEIGVHSITNNVLSSYWQEATVDELVAEFQGQRQIISKFANIAIDDVIGSRVPNLVLAGDKLFQSYQKSGIKYDNTWTSFNANKFFPYTLEYLSSQQCFDVCPQESYPKLWIVPIIDLVGNNSLPCATLAGCQIGGSVDVIKDWLIQQYKSNNKSHAPMTLLINSFWLRSDNAFDALKEFLNYLQEEPNTFIVSASQLLDWMKNPISVKDYKVKVPDRDQLCDPLTCKVEKPGEGLRYMNCCNQCPEQFPWLNNPDGNATL